MSPLQQTWFPWHSRNAASARLSALEAYGQFGKKPKHPPASSNPVSPQSPPTTIRHPADAAWQAVRPACRKPEPDEWRFTPRFPQESLGLQPSARPCSSGLLAGLILNVMPCVLPCGHEGFRPAELVGYETEGQAPRHFRRAQRTVRRRDLTWFLVLAFCVSALRLAWGGLFQGSTSIYRLLILVLLLSLSPFDVFTLPVLDFKVSASTQPKRKPTSPNSRHLDWPPVTAALQLNGGGRLGSTPASPRDRRRIHGQDQHGPCPTSSWPWPGARITPKPGMDRDMEQLVGFFLMGTAIYLIHSPPSRSGLARRHPARLRLAAWMWGTMGQLGA